MIEYVKASIFLAVLVFSVYESYCIPPEPRPVPFKSAGDASLSFIAGESGPPSKTTPKPNPIRDFVAPRQPVPSIAPTSPQILSSPNQNLPTRGQTAPVSPTRDFVNPNFNPQGHNPITKAPNINSSPNPTQKPVSLFEILKPGTPKNSGGRDFVNPNYKPGATIVPNTNSPKDSSQVLKPTQSNTGPSIPLNRPREPFPVLKPIGQPPNSGSRDYVNPNLKPREPFPALKPVQSSNVPKPKDPFPALGSRVSIPPSGPVISYANKASGGVTTSRPIVPKPAGGQTGPGDSSTAKPGEAGKAYEEGPKDPELREFSEALLKKDVNNAFKYVKLNIQGKTTSQSKNDEAPQNLLELNQDAFKLPTIEKLIPFYNNYILEVAENEFVTPQEKSEENDFLDAVLVTPIMQHTRNFLISNGKLGKDPKEFKDLLRTTWFSMYSRGHGKVGSSGFEHIFLAELKKDKNEVSGLHNWVYFHEAEQKKLVNYLGYMKKIDLGEKGAILKFHFSLNDVDKPVSSIFVGTSPELEMALYTTCYVFRPNRVCPLRLAGHNFIVRAYSLKYRGKQLLGSAFPEI